MSTADNNKDTDVCANCGKGEDGGRSLKACTACKLVKYCSRECQIAHRPQHKKACKKRAAELHEIKLFKQPPPEHGDCPICFQRMPSLFSGSTYVACCGKLICNGCFFAPVYDHQGNVIAEEKCPFCRTPTPSSEDELLKLIQKRIQEEDGDAMNDMGGYYKNGMFGFPQDNTKALELWHRAAELGHSGAYSNIGSAYNHGHGVEVDKKKAKQYWELAAMGGNVKARYNLGVMELQAYKDDRALKHYMIAVRGGAKNSLDAIKIMFKDGSATKDDYTTALRAYQEYLDEIKSDQRDKAAAAADRHKYY